MQDTTRTWRDIADQLTPCQRSKYERYEQEFQGMPAHLLLALARDDAESNLVNDFYSDVPLPPGAVNAEAFEGGPDGVVTRTFWGTERGEDITVHILGEQVCNGNVLSRVIMVGIDGSCMELDAAQARLRAADLLAAADELDAADIIDEAQR